MAGKVPRARFALHLLTQVTTKIGSQTVLSRKRIVLAAVAALIVLGGATGGMLISTASGEATEILALDVAENGFRWVVDETPELAENGMPQHGTEFITLGYLYPAGTLDGTNGVNPDGTPEFPDKVLGTWICRGWYLPGASAEPMAGPVVVTTQTFLFGDETGARTIVSDGIERMEVGVPFQRAITGGTGKKFEFAHGVQTQTFLGLQPEDRAYGVNNRVELKIR